MSKVEVDLAALAAAISNTIMGFAQTNKEPEREFRAEVTEKLTKKRGRPRKVKVVDPELDEDGVDRNNFTATAKRDDFNINHNNDSDRKQARRVPFKKKARINNFVDNLTLATGQMYDKNGKKIVYPEHAPPRELQEEQEYICDSCHKPFMAFASYIPSKIEGNQPLIRCYGCNTK